MIHPELAQCYRCQASHGRDDEPPIDWPPLADREGAVVGVICPDCHQAVLDEPYLGLEVLSMVPVPDGSETLKRTAMRHLTWLNSQPGLTRTAIREAYEQHGRGYWQAAYGDDPGFAYIPLARANPHVREMAETYDPADQFVVVIRDQMIGIYKARMVSGDQVAFLN